MAKISFCIAAFIIFLLCNDNSLQAQGIKLLVHTRGVHQSKISLILLSGSVALKPLVVINEINMDESGTIQIPKENLPGEFVLRFDYKEKETSTPYPSEKHIFINDQNLELWVNPLYANNIDSTWFQKDERENTTFARFSKQNGERKAKLALLQNFLVNYDDLHSTFYKQGIKEYEKRRDQYNLWLNDQIKKEQQTFVSHAFQFQYVQQVSWTGTETDRAQSMKDHYFDGVNFSDPLITRMDDLKEWMNAYVNLYGASATSVPLRDSLFTWAGKRAIEKAKKGSPEVYGWMVDYFYNGFESFGITAGTKMLQTYLDDPACLTRKRAAITNRLEGIKTLIPGSIAPDFNLVDEHGKDVSFKNYPSRQQYKLVLFWSAECSHCQELMKKLYPWYQEKGSKKLDVFALSVDETETEVRSWKNAINAMQGWKHARPEGGINSREAKAYYILSTPFMVLVESKTNKIVDLPETLEQLSGFLKL